MMRLLLVCVALVTAPTVFGLKAPADEHDLPEVAEGEKRFSEIPMPEVPADEEEVEEHPAVYAVPSGEDEEQNLREASVAPNDSPSVNSEDDIMERRAARENQDKIQASAVADKLDEDEREVGSISGVVNGLRVPGAMGLGEVVKPDDPVPEELRAAEESGADEETIMMAPHRARSTEMIEERMDMEWDQLSQKREEANANYMENLDKYESHAKGKAAETPITDDVTGGEVFNEYLAVSDDDESVEGIKAPEAEDEEEFRAKYVEDGSALADNL